MGAKAARARFGLNFGIPTARSARRFARGGWSLAKTALIAAVAGWTLRSRWPELTSHAMRDVSGLALSTATLLRQVILPTAAASLALGVVDFLVQITRIERVLRMTPDEQREESRAIDGDPNARSRRRRLAESWRGRSHDPLAGASLILLGPSGLTLVLAGGPPPGRIEIRAIARGPFGAVLRRAAARVGTPRVEAPSLALYLSNRGIAEAPLPADLATELGRVWPRNVKIT